MCVRDITVDGRKCFGNANVDVNFLFEKVKRISVDGASEPEESMVKDATSEGAGAF